MPVYDYRADQLAKIQPKAAGTFLPKIKITQAVQPGATNHSPKRWHETNWLDISDECATALVKWLHEHYNITP